MATVVALAAHPNLFHPHQQPSSSSPKATAAAAATLQQRLQKLQTKQEIENQLKHLVESTSLPYNKTPDECYSPIQRRSRVALVALLPHTARTYVPPAKGAPHILLLRTLGNLIGGSGSNGSPPDVVFFHTGFWTAEMLRAHRSSNSFVPLMSLFYYTLKPLNQ